MNRFLTITINLIFIIVAFLIAQKSCDKEYVALKEVEKTTIALRKAQSEIKRYKEANGQKVAQIEVLTGDLEAYKAAFQNEREYSDGLKGQIEKLLAVTDKNTVTATAAKTTIFITDTVETVVIQHKERPLYPTYQANFGSVKGHYFAKVSMGKDTSFINLWVYNSPTLETTWEKQSKSGWLRFVKEPVLVTKYTDSNPYLTVDTLVSYVNLPSDAYSDWNIGIFGEINGQGSALVDLASRTAYQDVFGVFVNRSIGNARVEIKGGKSFIQNTWTGSVQFRISLFRD